jgi:(E)-4-hydroxy-3-methylbut-2-enyl-diphosphate synthase
VAVPSQDDAEALPTIARKSPIPVIADIHFQPKYVFAAIDAGCAAVRVNPGNIKAFDDKVKEIAAAASGAGVPIRIGVNAGSLDKRLLEKYGRPDARGAGGVALWECSLFEEHGFRDIKISVKHNDPVVMISAYRMLSERCDYPLHLGVTEAGPRSRARSSRRSPSARCSPRASATPSASRCRPLRSRRSRSAADPRVAEPAPARARDRVVPVLRPRPGRRLQAGRGGHRRAGGMTVPCGSRSWAASSTAPARRGGRPRGRVRQRQGADLRQGRGHQDRPESQIVETLIEEALRLAEEMGEAYDPDAVGVASGAPTVRVTS